ncbi:MULTISPECIES: hypothetical protein [unclassified Micromonospora]|uniref:hypothetical protein n=1 Tax=unclassified Micromonospora TaxID=2617518 RepID=UPI002E1FE12B
MLPIRSPAPVNRLTEGMYVSTADLTSVGQAYARVAAGVRRWALVGTPLAAGQSLTIGPRTIVVMQST